MPMETDETPSPPRPEISNLKSPISNPPLDYAPPRRFSRLRRGFRPGSVGFFALILALAGAGTWGARKWRLKEDEKAFNERAVINWAGGYITFNRPPSVASLRHLTRLAGMRGLSFDWSGPADPTVLRTLPGRGLPWVKELSIVQDVDVDGWLKELARPDSGLKTLTELSLYNTQITDAGLKELARPDSGLKALTALGLYNTQVTDRGVAALKQARPGLTIYRQ